MKMAVFDASLFVAGVAAAAAAHVDPGPLALRSRAHSSVALARHRFDRGQALFGDTQCPCIGFDNIDGETTVVLENGDEIAYPADLGARCEKWDDGVHPGCKEGETPGLGNGWCGQAWCFVDSCNCNIPVMAKTAEYVPDARYRGRPIFFSYATCGGEDMWTKELPKVGTAGCRCIGFDNIPGTTEVTIDGKVISYPAEIGGTCQAWDKDMHPLCTKGKDSPQWCKQRWCYIDPCSCSMEEVPKVTMYLPEATFTGKSLYYSYETCSAKDTFTAIHNTEACVNQDTKEACEELKLKSGADKCAWTGVGDNKCVGAELVNHPLCAKVIEKEEAEKDSKAKSSAHVAARLAFIPAALVAAVATFTA